jgi:polyisoprenoid-binding protein YceI
MRTEIIFSLALGLGCAGMARAQTPRAQAPAGGLVLAGSSTVGDWTCREATVQPAPAAPAASPGTTTTELSPAGMTLRFPVQDIDCGDGVMNDRLRQALQADRHPTISFALPPDQLKRAVQAGSAPVAVNGTLTIAGRTEPVQTQVTVTPAPGHAVRVQGEQSLRMSAFGVKPPRLFFGALKVRDLVHVAFDLVLRGPALALLGHGYVR